jgi:hypothetical protein
MGGGGGFDPISIIGNMVFGSVLGPMARTSDSGGNDSAEAAAEAEQQAAEARRKADRKKAETALLAKARQTERAAQAGQDAQNESLGTPAGTPVVAASLLKARLGQ